MAFGTTCQGGHANWIHAHGLGVEGLSGNVTAFFANSTPKMSTFFARSHFDFGGDDFVHPLNPRSEIMTIASKIDKMK